MRKALPNGNYVSHDLSALENQVIIETLNYFSSSLEYLSKILLKRDRMNSRSMVLSSKAMLSMDRLANHLKQGHGGCIYDPASIYPYTCVSYMSAIGENVNLGEFVTFLHGIDPTGESPSPKSKSQAKDTVRPVSMLGFSSHLSSLRNLGQVAIVTQNIKKRR